MMEPGDELTASYYRCRQGERFLDDFYEIFLAKSPEIAQMFAKTDFRLQKLMLRQSLLEVLCFARGIAGTKEEIERLGRLHQELGVTAEMYSLWLDALCEAIQRHDPAYTPELEQHWRAAVQQSTNKMIAVGPPETGEASARR